MRIIYIIFLLSLSTHSISGIIKSSVYDIDTPISNKDHYLVLLNNGQVLKIKKGRENLVSLIRKTKSNSSHYTFYFDDDRFIDKVFFDKDQTDFFEDRPLSGLYTQYVPTTVASVDVLKRYFKEATYNPKESQCFNRAMVWSYEWWKNHSLKSMKLFIFFTRSYIRRYNFEWWFHVAPYAHVMMDVKVVERVLDVKYSRGPLAFKVWSDLFMKNDASCMVITKYSDYADYPYTGECYFYRANMYTYQPTDLQMLEAWGYTKNNFINKEVKEAYREAFDTDI